MTPTTGLTATTDRQKQIKKLLGQGKNPQQIAKQLKISDNAVHQQVRRMRQQSGGAKASTPARKTGGSTKRSRSRTAKASPSTGRKSSRTRTAAVRPATPAAPVTAEELFRSEIVAAEESKGEKVALIESLRGQIAEAEAAVIAHDAEIERKRDVLAVMTGEKVAHAKPAPPKAGAAKSRSSRASTRKGASGARANGSAQTTGGKGAQASQDGAQAAGASAPDADAPKSQAEREATADHDGGAPAEEAAPATA